jgi:lysine N6-hydroxylase
MSTHFDLIGIGVGPFHLSLAALLEKHPEKKHLFLDQKDHFQWHNELMFADADMQTSFYKDLVTPVDPTNRHSYLNYLVQHGLFYAFMNTNRKVLSRKEFEIYGQWVSQNLESLKFKSNVRSLDFKDNKFVIQTPETTYTSQNISIATGLTQRIPDCAKPFLGKDVFHAKSGGLGQLNLEGKRTLIIGGGQTGVEIYRNALKGKWGNPSEVKLISRRQNLEPLDESPFTNDYFTPHYVNEFYQIDSKIKPDIISAQKLASDGNTPAYLELLYNDLYYLKHVEKKNLKTKIYPKRTLVGMSKTESGAYHAVFENSFLAEQEVFEADVIILSTGFSPAIPSVVDGIKHLLDIDSLNRFSINKAFSLKWKGPEENKIYALNFGRHTHGIAEPQTSLMAWRSATIINDLMGKAVYQSTESVPTFIQYGKDQD